MAIAVARTKLIPHAMADIFPRMTAGEFDSLKADIRENGVREPIWLHEGRIVDGKHRYRACDELGIDCPTRDWDGNGSLIAFVLSMNLHRRHLSASQLATVANESLPELEAEAKRKLSEAGKKGGENSGAARRGEAPKPNKRIEEASPRSVDKAAAMVGVNPTYVADAKKLKAESPELYEEVKRGAITLPHAKRAAEKKKPAAKKRKIKPRREYFAPLKSIVERIVGELAKLNSAVPGGRFFRDSEKALAAFETAIDAWELSDK